MVQKVVRTANPISHLFFADDSLLFFRANSQEVDEIKRIIQVYETSSGQRINFDKTKLSASGNVSVDS